MSSSIVDRIWARDASLWTGADEASWLGWLDEPARVAEDIDLLLQFADSIVDRVDAIVLLGMGGSSLAPEVIRRTFRQETFHVLDTTHPQAIRDLERKLDSYKVYYNRHRCHTGLAGITPAQLSGAPAHPIAKLESYRWRQHCNGLFQTPIAA